MMRVPLWQKVTLLLVIGWGILAALPNVLNENQRLSLPDFLPDQMINLGLDLQGGAHLVLQVEMAELWQRQYETLEDQVRRTLREAKLNYRALASDPEQVTFTGFRAEQHSDIRRALRDELGVDVNIDQSGSDFTLQYTTAYRTELDNRIVQQALEILRSRVDEFGVSEPVLQRQGADRIIIQLPGIRDVGRAKDIIGRTAQLSFHMVRDNADIANPPAGTQVLYEEDPSGLRMPLVVSQRPEITGERLANAGVTFDQMTGEPAVSVTFDGLGTRTFGKLTTDNVGRRMAIVLDGVIYSAPVLREPILGGTAQITGRFDPQEAEDLATVLRAGALPAKVEVVEERTVGPSLGADSVAAGELAITVGFILVLVVMLGVYRRFGIIANVALLANITLMIGVMSAVGFTLTLPGMAGILLTIGMAVDANVLIFERVREEANGGRKPRSALDHGFKGVTSTIMDANITTLIAAIVLFAMGSGPVKGFALTLTVGILTSLFTALLLTRVALISYVNWRNPKVLKV